MNYIYLVLGIVLGIVFIGRGKNARNHKYIPFEAKAKLNTKKTKEDYDEWCSKEALGCTLVGVGFIAFGLSATFMDTNLLIGNIIAVISLAVFIVGFFLRIVNNKKHLNHYFTK